MRYDALEPSIDTETMRLHHDKHHAAYVKGANDALAKLAEVTRGKAREPVGDSDLTEKLTFNLSGHLLHSTFWAIMGHPSGEPRGDLAIDIKNISVPTTNSRRISRLWQPRSRGMAGACSPTSPFRRKLIVLQARNHQLSVAWNAIPLW